MAALEQVPTCNFPELVKATRDIIDDFEVFDYDPWDDPDPQQPSR